MAINTVILKENQNNETSGSSGTCSIRWHIDSQGKPWAWTTANARKKVGLLFHAQEIFQARRSKVCHFKTAWWTGHVGKTWLYRSTILERTHRVYSKKTARTWSKDWHRIRFLKCSPEKGSEMTGEHLYHRMHTNFQREEPMYIKRHAGFWKEPSRKFEWVRSKNSVQGINHTNFTENSSRFKDIKAMSTNQTSSDVTSRQKVRNTATGLAIHTRERMHIVDSGASLHMMGLSSLICKEKNAFLADNILNFQTTSGIVVSDTSASVNITELGAYPWVHLVGSFSVSAHVGRTMLGNLVIPFLGCLEWLPGCSQTQIVPI